jgi:LuxR family transcriptional regulator, quorum-sensing system regulator BjaR1
MKIDPAGSAGISGTVPAPSAEELLRCLEALDACRSPSELRDMLLNWLRPFGFVGFSLAIDRKLKSISVHLGIMTTWPAGTNEYYVSEGLFRTDPVMLHSRSNIDPFVWDMSIYDQSREDHARIVRIRLGLGTDAGIVVPVMEAMGGRTTLLLSGKGFPKCKQTLLILRALVEHLLARLHHMKGAKTWALPLTAVVRDAPLTPREREVMGWIAFGKSSRDVAQILSLSEHTVNEYIAGAVAKLKASNRTEAVALALLTDEIDH